MKRREGRCKEGAAAREERGSRYVCGGGLVEPRPSHRLQHRWTEAAQPHLCGLDLRHSGGVWTVPAKTGNAKDKGRGHDDEKEGEEEEGTSRERVRERVRDVELRFFKSQCKW